MDNLQKINEIPFLDIFAKLWIMTEKSTTVNEYKIQVPWESRISNWSYKVNVAKNAVFANWATRPQWSPFMFMKEHLNASDDRKVFEWFEENFNIKTNFEKPKKNTTKKEILENVWSFLIRENFTPQIMSSIKTWLVNRWFTLDFLNSEEWTERIHEVFYQIWFCENPATRTKNKDSKEWLPSKPVLIFPALDHTWKIIWAKLRKINNLPEDESTKDSKSINISWSSSWVIFPSMNFIKQTKQVIIVEWEPDYICMRMMGFKNVIWNLGWVASCKEIIRDLVKTVESVVIAYDNDWPWRIWAQKLAEFCKREMSYIKYIDRNNIHWEKYKDINEFYEAWFWFEDFNRMIQNATVIKQDDDWRWDYDNKDSKVTQTMTNKNPFIYLRKNYEYYDIYENRIVKKESVCDWMWIDNKELKELLLTWEIKTFYDVCYWKWWKKEHYNILDERVILEPSNKPEIHEDIKFLIENLCWNKRQNINWLYKAILYKYLNINDVLVPAVLFKWVWWSWKWTFIKLLTKIFSPENIMCWLWTQSLTSDFCPYVWNKIIVEINELWWWNHKDAIRILDKLKSLIFEPKIMVNMKWIQPREVDNIAWFILSSNHKKPLQLDSWSSWNRRFTIINTWDWIPLEKWKQINKTISDVDNVKNFLAWLLEQFPEVKNMSYIEALDNEDKSLLTDQSESFVDKFFSWLDENFPEINRITTRERNILLEIFRNDIWEDGYEFNKKYSPEYFNNNLPHYVEAKKVSIRWKTVQGYEIIKKDNQKPVYFETDKYDRNSIEFMLPEQNILKNNFK